MSVWERAGLPVPVDTAVHRVRRSSPGMSDAGVHRGVAIYRVTGWLASGGLVGLLFVGKRNLSEGVAIAPTAKERMPFMAVNPERYGKRLDAQWVVNYLREGE